MKKFKKIMLIWLPIILGLGFFVLTVHAQNTVGFGTTPDALKWIGVSWASQGTTNGGGLLDVVKNFVNWVLGLLSLIALIVLLYGGFNMVTAAGDDAKYKKGFKILQQAAIGLAVVGLSWIIVSFIFYIVSPSSWATVTQ
jgi:hypothetical protein